LDYRFARAQQALAAGARCDREALRLKRMALGACDGWVSLFFPSIRGEVARSAEALERQRQEGGPSFAGFAKGGDSGSGILSEESQYLQGKRRDRN